MEKKMWQGWFDLLAGVWLFMSAFNPGMRTPASMIAAGLVVAVFGFWGAGERKSWQGIINGIIGIWLLLSTIWLHLAVPENYLFSGLVISFLAIWNIISHPRMKDPLIQKH
jgi:hypothetical protein